MRRLLLLTALAFLLLPSSAHAIGQRAFNVQVVQAVWNLAATTGSSYTKFEADWHWCERAEPRGWECRYRLHWREDRQVVRCWGLVWATPKKARLGWSNCPELG